MTGNLKKEELKRKINSFIDMKNVLYDFLLELNKNNITTSYNENILFYIELKSSKIRFFNYLINSDGCKFTIDLRKHTMSLEFKERHVVSKIFDIIWLLLFDKEIHYKSLKAVKLYCSNYLIGFEKESFGGLNLEYEVNDDYNLTSTGSQEIRLPYNIDLSGVI